MNHEPDKSVGGTFHYDREGRFTHHTPPTQPASAPAAIPESAPACVPDAAPAAEPHRSRGWRRGKPQE